MVGFEMLAQVQRDLTAEKVSNLVASQTALILHITGRYGHEVHRPPPCLLQAAAKLRELSEVHYKVLLTLLPQSMTVLVYSQHKLHLIQHE